MEKFPSVEIVPAEELVEDVDVKGELAVIEAEDLKSDPFVRSPPSPGFVPVEKPKKPRIKGSDKQKAHLANLRKLAKERKQANTSVSVAPAPTPTPTPAPAPTPTPAPAVGYDQFLGYMGKFQETKAEENRKATERRLAEEKEEAEREAKYFKKFQERSVPTPSVSAAPITQEFAVQDFGIYSNYF